ncbi:CUE domain protein [Dictyocaulus viviparus]|uniref:CUE domain protein n=1 Tax=Dictyocaulus viviparus TaxID=29172 RepID=A0A0D8XCG9_DICVI|nr:CUE domain protein [Dictyocaulus viviparus]
MNHQLLGGITMGIITEDTKDLEAMFPDVDKEVIRCVLEESRGDKDATVSALLEMSKSESYLTNRRAAVEVRVLIVIGDAAVLGKRHGRSGRPNDINILENRGFMIVKFLAATILLTSSECRLGGLPAVCSKLYDLFIWFSCPRSIAHTHHPSLPSIPRLCRSSSPSPKGCKAGVRSRALESVYLCDDFYHSSTPTFVL